MGIEIHGDRSFPVGDGDVLDWRGGAGDAGIVDQHIEPAVAFPEIGKNTIHVRCQANVSHSRCGVRMIRQKAVDGWLGYIAHVNSASVP